MRASLAAQVRPSQTFGRLTCRFIQQGPTLLTISSCEPSHLRARMHFALDLSVDVFCPDFSLQVRQWKLWRRRGDLYVLSPTIILRCTWESCATCHSNTIPAPLQCGRQLIPERATGFAANIALICSNPLAHQWSESSCGTCIGYELRFCRVTCNFAKPQPGSF